MDTTLSSEHIASHKVAAHKTYSDSIPLTSAVLRHPNLSERRLHLLSSDNIEMFSPSTLPTVPDLPSYPERVEFPTNLLRENLISTAPSIGIAAPGGMPSRECRENSKSVRLDPQDTGYRGQCHTPSLNQDWGLRDGEKDRMIYVSWLPRVARAEDLQAKRRKELMAKDNIIKLGFKGLKKVLLYPPSSAHCKLLFESEESARQFLLRYGGREMSHGSERWKRDICEAYDVNIKEGQSGGISSTKVKVIWADERRQEIQAVQDHPAISIDNTSPPMTVLRQTVRHGLQQTFYGLA
eukprot:Selendium_serpulae@DN5184_c0_g1_i2.p1